MNLDRLTEEAQGVARAHIEPLGFTLTVRSYTDGVVLEARDAKGVHQEHISLKGMPEPVQGEYVHCRVHALAARLIARRYPT